MKGVGGGSTVSLNFVHIKSGYVNGKIKERIRCGFAN